MQDYGTTCCPTRCHIAFLAQKISHCNVRLDPTAVRSLWCRIPGRFPWNLFSGVFGIELATAPRFWLTVGSSRTYLRSTRSNNRKIWNELSKVWGWNLWSCRRGLPNCKGPRKTAGVLSANAQARREKLLCWLEVMRCLIWSSCFHCFLVIEANGLTSKKDNMGSSCVACTMFDMRLVGWNFRARLVLSRQRGAACSFHVLHVAPPCDM